MHHFKHPHKHLHVYTYTHPRVHIDVQLSIVGNTNLNTFGSIFASVQSIGSAILFSGSRSFYGNTVGSAFGNLRVIGNVTLQLPFNSATGIFVGSLSGTASAINATLFDSPIQVNLPCHENRRNPLDHSVDGLNKDSVLRVCMYARTLVYQHIHEH